MGREFMINTVVTSSLEKVISKRTYTGSQKNSFSALEGEILSFQIVYWSDIGGKYRFVLEHDDDIEAQAFFVGNVPVDFPTFLSAAEDHDYMSHDSGLFPNILEPADRDWVQVSHICHALWFSVKGKSGNHKLTFKFYNYSDELMAENDINVEIIAATLPEQELRYTDWFHVDCIADYYGLKVFSEEHWSMVEKFLRIAKEHGSTVIFTPVFTPPLDTEIGSERPTVQLVKITKQGEKYEFDFSALRRWIKLCRNIGFKYFEMPHLFTQWGAKCTPKIVVTENGEEIKLFGWHVESTSEIYENFLSQFLPSLTAVLKEEGVLENTYFHISDEPNETHLEHYKQVKQIAGKYLEGCTVMDALSNRDLYEKSGIQVPVPSTLHTDSFKDLPLQERWCYYCCSETVNASNRFIALPSARNRSIGVQLYKGRMDGFLHWGFNFYYSQFSRMLIDPFRTNDAYNAFPAGDAFCVYPAKNGPIPSISIKVFYEALQDLRALKLLESFIGYEETVALVEEILGERISFAHCFSAEKLLELRDAVNHRIAELI